MTNAELQQKYNLLKNRLDSSKLEMAKAQANLETAEKQRDSALADLLEMTKTTTIEDAKLVAEKLNNKLSEMIKEAEALLNDTSGK